MILAILLTAFSIACLIVIWGGCSRCQKCHEWCLDDWDCLERQMRQARCDEPFSETDHEQT